MGRFIKMEALRARLAASVLLAGISAWGVVASPAQAGMASGANSQAMRGVVEDGAGKPVVGATVKLERSGESGVMETTSALDGSFAFAPAGAGKFELSARKDSMASDKVEVSVESSGQATSEGGSQRIVLRLAPGGSGGLGSQPMEFSDSPSFTIAAVTDWTAAGGHGSDAILRTSESLTRDAVHLKGTAGGTDEFADPALKEALTLEKDGQYPRARQLVGGLLAKEKTGDRLRLAGELDEKLGDPVTAVNEFEQAVREDGSEENYFAWGSELLLHRAIWQAKDVFTAGAQRFPKSARMATALGAALFACALYDDAARRLCEAADLSPESDEAYLFLGKVEMAAPNPLQCAQLKLAEFEKRRPENPLASYYDAMAMWKESGRSADPLVLGNVEALLNRTVALDAKCSDAYLELGNLGASRHDNAAAIGYYLKAIDANPQSAEAHYRLGLAYDRAEDHEKAKREFAIHEELNKQQAAEVERQRREVKQFLVKESAPSNP